MNFEPTEEQAQIRDVARAFARDRIAPSAAEWDAQSHLPLDVLKEAAGLGFASIYIAEDVGGAGLGRTEAAIVFEELATACPSTTAVLTIHTMVSWMVDRFGSEDQRRRFLPQLASLDRLGAYCLTEPGSGSDAASLKTRAARDGDHYVISGTKAFISNAPVADLFAVMVRTGEEGARGISCVLVESGTPGLSFGKKENKLGWRSQPTSTVNFDGCRVPVANRIGAEGEGFKIAMMGLDGGRINIAACSLGGARACLEAAMAYARERRQFGRPIADFQATQFKLADMATELDAARLMVWRAAAALDAKSPDATMHCAMAKRFATDAGFRIVDEALQLHGGYGYIRDFPIERYFRDLRVHRILEGTNEVMRLVIARRLLGA